MRLDGHARFPDGRAWHIHFEFTAPAAAQAVINPRPFLLAVLPLAMLHGLPLRCEHGVDAITRRNLDRWGETYAGWIPGRMRRVALELPEADCVRTPEARGSLQAFSGGVDSCHTLVHRPKSARHAGLMVHGLDIPLGDTAGFRHAWENSAEILRGMGAEAYQLRTNLRERNGIRPGPDWETECHGIWLTATLACLEPWFEMVIIPSSFCHDALTTPWGSHPQTDPLLGSAAVPYLHLGAELDKLGKIATLAGNRLVTDRLRVCWQKGHAAENCGRCFKCIATQLCLRLSGVHDSAAFPKACTADDLARLPIKEGSNRYLVTRLAETARGAGQTDLAQALERALVRARLRGLPRWLDRLGLRTP
ncbi:MAG: hypothetical protein ACO23N_07895 [Opitutales bacterium]